MLQERPEKTKRTNFSFESTEILPEYFITRINSVLIRCDFLKTNITRSLSTGARFSKVPETFRARKAIFRSSECKHGEVYTPEISCMKQTSLHTKNM